MSSSNPRSESFVRGVLSALKGDVRLNLWWLGQSAFLLQWKQFHLLIDPLLTQPEVLDSGNFGPERGLVVEPEDLSFMDAVLYTHRHPDHLDLATLRRLLQVNEELTVVVPEALREEVSAGLDSPHVHLTGLEDNVSLHVGEAALTAVGASHDQPRRDAQGRWPCLGYVIQVGPWTLYHSGDTIFYEGLSDKLQPFSVDLALLPISPQGPGDEPDNILSPREAARLASSIEARLAIPHHFGTFDFEPGLTEEFRAECTRRGQLCRVLRPGELWSDRELEVLAEQEEKDEFPGGRFRVRGGRGEEEEL